MIKSPSASRPSIARSAVPRSCAASTNTTATNRPTIHVLDDGKPELRFSTNCPTEAAMVDQLIETDYDIGLSAGRNRLLDAGDTPIVVFTDDDHLVTQRTKLPELVAKLNKHNDIDLLAALSNDEERPRLLRSNGRRLRILSRILRNSEARFAGAITSAIASSPIATFCKRSAGTNRSRSKSTGISSGDAKSPASMSPATSPIRSSTNTSIRPATSDVVPQFLKRGLEQTRIGKGDLAMIELPALEYHVAHGCNLSCQQCSHYSNFHVAGKLPTVDDADAEYSRLVASIEAEAIRIARRRATFEPTDRSGTFSSPDSIGLIAI